MIITLAEIRFGVLLFITIGQLTTIPESIVKKGKCIKYMTSASSRSGKIRGKENEKDHKEPTVEPRCGGTTFNPQTQVGLPGNQGCYTEKPNKQSIIK